MSATRSETETEQLRVLEALLFASRAPLTADVLAAYLPEGTDIAARLAALAEDYAGRGVNLVRAGGGWALRTAADLGPALRREAEVQRRLSRAAAFCGFYVAKADTNLFKQASKVVMARNQGRTVISMANDFQGELAEFAIIIPVPTSSKG